jgi:hypothetical protein
MSQDDITTPEATSSEPANFLTFSEGRVLLPDGYEDRTTNLLVPANPQTQPNLSVARDWMKPGETLATYVDRQLGLLKSQLASHKLLNRDVTWLGRPAADAADVPDESEPASGLKGERIDATYKNGKQTLFQRQAAFEVAVRRILVFTATSPRSFGSDFDAVWDAWLASYTPPSHPAPRIEHASAANGDDAPAGA